MDDKDTNVPNKNDFIRREATVSQIFDGVWTKTDADGYVWVLRRDVIHTIDEFPAADVVEEENILKFYYVRSIDEYWIGRRLDNFYYARYESENQQWVWAYSRYLPWGEHVVSPTSLWKEYTYPSEPEEIPFTDWLKGFAKKYIASDVRPVIKCKNCRWWTKQEKSLQGRCELGGFYPTGEWFCANGERHNCGADMR